ncbi:MAG: NADH-ubiquinone oxidoreductase-F iron-sulfur binding region domain-containing protein [Mycobacteriales bacterium]
MSTLAQPGTAPATWAGPLGWDRVLPASGADGRLRDIATHQQTHGPLPYDLTARELLFEIAESGLTGRGGAGFPVHRKLSAVAAGRNPVVVANGAEGEPASGKDRLLLSLAPHLVLDGLQLAARAVGARDAFIYVHEGPLVPMMRGLVDTRAPAGLDAISVAVVEAPARFISGQESAVVARLSGGAAKPRHTPPPVFQKGVRGRPTLVHNVETLAHLALIARHGAAWFRALGTPDEPGTMLLTVSGAVRNPGVVEVPLGTRLIDALALAGGVSDPVRALLVGGYHGSWIGAEGAPDLPLSVAGLQAVQSRPGAGVLVALPAAACGVVETSRAATYLAGEVAGQCGPCLNGLPMLAAELRSLAAGRSTGGGPPRIAQLMSVVQGRGSCHHPDGTTRFVRSAMQVFAAEVRQHLDGRCTATDRRAILPVPSERTPR